MCSTRTGRRRPAPWPCSPLPAPGSRASARRSRAGERVRADRGRDGPVRARHVNEHARASPTSPVPGRITDRAVRFGHGIHRTCSTVGGGHHLLLVEPTDDGRCTGVRGHRWHRPGRGRTMDRAAVGPLAHPHPPTGPGAVVARSPHAGCRATSTSRGTSRSSNTPTPGGNRWGEAGADDRGRPPSEHAAVAGLGLHRCHGRGRVPGSSGRLRSPASPFRDGRSRVRSSAPFPFRRKCHHAMAIR